MVASYGPMWPYVKGNLLLFKFYLDNIWKLHQLPQVIIHFLVYQTNICRLFLQWMRNPDTLQEVVEERVAAGDGGKEGFTLKLPRAVARCNLSCSIYIMASYGFMLS